MPDSMVRLLASSATVMTIAAVVIPYGSAAIFSFDALASTSSTAGNTSGTSLAATVVQLVLLALGLLLGLVSVFLLGEGRTREWLAGRRGPAPGSWCLSAGLALTALMVGYYLMLATGIPASSPSTDASTAPAVEITRGVVLGGLGEELLVVALPVIVARAVAPTLMTRPWAVALLLAVLVIVRMSYHVHYGAWVLSLLPWAITAAVVYLAFGQVWPLILQHAGYNVVLDLEDVGLLSQAGMLILLTGGGLALTALGVARARRATDTPAQDPLHRAVSGHRPD